jgi:MYXO-CTERM domain-containing protein
MTHTHAWNLMALLATLAVAPVASAGYLIEATFDDADDGTGPDTGDAEVDNLQNNFSSLGSLPRRVELFGDAHRSAFGEGRYGRGADLPGGGGSVRITNWDVTAQGAGTVAVWVRVRDLEAGRLFHVEDSVALGLDGGDLVLEVWDEFGGVTDLPTGASWPADGGWHHLAVMIVGSDEGIQMTLAVDFAEVATLEGGLQAPPEDPDVILGEGFDGLLDELVVLSDVASSSDVWDFDPDAECPAGLSCNEEVIATTPVGLSRQVPVRMKTVYDPALCNAETPCPLLIAISGGGKCADNYAPSSKLEYYAEDGFVAVTVDPYCEGDNSFKTYPNETSQLVVAKDHLMTDSPLAASIDGPDYVATGCSHGCGSVTHWMMLEDDFPHRTYGNSCSLDWILCAYVSGELCPLVEEYLEERIVEEIGTLDLSDPAGEQFYGTQPIAAVSPDTVASREFAASWGLNLEGDVCTPDGYSDCYEMSLWGMTYSSLRVRDIWQRLEPEGAPTGYFVENHESDCKHCASVGTPAWDCASCLLKHGRAGMADACPECLAYEDETIVEGGAAMDCPIDADWYEDPLTASFEGDDDDAADDDDGEDDLIDGNGSCECRAAPGWDEVSLAALTAVAAVLAVRRRRR